MTEAENSRLRRNFDLIGAITAAAAVLGQGVLMLANLQTDPLEGLLRFVSYFTILTNTLVAVYYGMHHRYGERAWVTRPGALTAVTAFILIVGIVYQVVLRWTWSPTGWQWVVDELLHSVVPIYALIYFVLFVGREDLRFRSVLPWMAYPLVYFALVLLRGSVSGFYPYPFVDVTTLGYPRVWQNALFITGFALLVIAVLILLGKRRTRSRASAVPEA